MTTSLILLLCLGLLGAFDTLWYHEWTQELPNRPGASRELVLHSLRDFAYTIIFGTLAWFTWNGWLAIVFCSLLAFEIVITLLDFIEEDRSRPLPAGERIMHTIMAIVYGAFLANLLPQVVNWYNAPSCFQLASHGVLSIVLSFFAIGVFASGCRDLFYATFRSV